MQNMTKEDLAWCVRRIPQNLKNVMKEHGTKISVGGGFVRSCITGDKLNDIDIFTNSKDTADILSTALAKEMKCQPIKTKNAITLLRHVSTPFQFIHRWVYEHPRDILSDFDFTICCSSIWFDGHSENDITETEADGWKGVVHDCFYQDLAAKRLRYTHPVRDEEAGGSLIRVLKYYNKGYRITLSSLGGVAARLFGAVEGVDFNEKFLSNVLTGLLVEVDPSTITEDATLLQ